MKAFEIIEADNGWIILEGTSFASQTPYMRHKWVAETSQRLADLVKELADSELKHD